MKIKNIERNILYLLGNEWLKSNTLGPFDTMLIFDEFSDIPDKNLKDAINTIDEGGFVEISSNYRNISLTQKGLSKIKVLKQPQNGELPVPTELE